MTGTIFEEPEEYDIAESYLSALINDDYSGLDDEEAYDLNMWEIGVRKGRQGHFAVPDEETYDNFTTCDISGLYANCAQVVFWPIKA